tara:strand:- start:72 stop:854 length:783 start_codon:yes stop_codon:yes gene_type:complete
MIHLTNCFYSFDRRLSIYDDNTYILDLYKASMITFFRTTGMKPNMYADTETLKQLKNYYSEGIDISNKTFSHVDDLKIWIHTQNNLDCITIDGDILFSQKLQFPNEYNTKVYFDVQEVKELTPQFDSVNGYTTLRKLFQKYDVASHVENYNYDHHYACNVGILKFNCEKTKNLLIKSYYKIKEYFESNIKNDTSLSDKAIPSIILSQYYWGSICESQNIQKTFLRNFNKYTHLVSYHKFKEKNISKVYEIIKTETQSKLL